MLELLIVLGGLGVLSGLALLLIFVQPLALALGSLAVMVLGLAFGLPAGIYYHMVLRREILRQGALPRGWYWHPLSLHAELEPAAWARVRPWFLLGALGFLLIVTGACVAALAMFVTNHGHAGCPRVV